MVLVREEAAGRAFGSQGTLPGALVFCRLRFRLPAAPAQATETDGVPFVLLEEERRVMSRNNNKKGGRGEVIPLYMTHAWRGADRFTCMAEGRGVGETTVHTVFGLVHLSCRAYVSVSREAGNKRRKDNYENVTGDGERLILHNCTNVWNSGIYGMESTVADMRPATVLG